MIVKYLIRNLFSKYKSQFSKYKSHKAAVKNGRGALQRKFANNAYEK